LTKFTYVVPLDSFEECRLEYLTIQDTFHNTLPVRGYAASAHFDTLPQIGRNDFSGTLTYWNSIPDTLFVTLYIPSQREFDLYLAYGFWQTSLPSTIISMQKNHLQGVMADAFDSMTASDILLKQDTLYSLTLRSFRETDALTWAVNSDSIYMVTIESLEKQQVELDVSGNQTGLLRSIFTGKDTLIFRPVSWGRYVRCSLSSVTNTPCSYSISLAPYKGPNHADSFEPDFISTNATLLVEGAMQEHTIFPENENDYFKMECKASDTFSFEIVIHPSAVPRDSLGFSFSPSFSDILGDFRIISKTDSGSITRYTYSKDLPDTLFFRATARKYTEYSIMLRR
jgi:hypothetical protein